MDQPYRERMDAARERVRVALDPQTGPEKSICDWLGEWDLPTLEIIADMTERVVRQARAESYELGWAEGVAHGRKGGAL